jgi:hypothetical protein
MVSVDPMLVQAELCKVNAELEKLRVCLSLDLLLLSLRVKVMSVSFVFTLCFLSRSRLSTPNPIQSWKLSRCA